MKSALTTLLLVPALAAAAAFTTTTTTTRLPILPTTRSNLLAAADSSSSTEATTTTESSSSLQEDIAQDLAILNRAAIAKQEDPDAVLAALLDLEKKMRKLCKQDYPVTAERMVQQLNGDWQLVFTTGTADTQKKLGGKINYFPIKAVQSFQTQTTPMGIENGIYVGDFAVMKFAGTMEFDLKKCRLEFDFSQLGLFNGLFQIPLKQGEAAKIGASSGLGSENNVQLTQKQDRKAFFNWISADETIATARGGGGGLALWKRVKQN